MEDASTPRPFKEVGSPPAALHLRGLSVSVCEYLFTVSDNQVIIVGAGPSGLVLAVLLAKHGIPVHVLEASHELDRQPRAAHYGPPAIPELTRAGVMDLMAENNGMRLNSMAWRRFTDHSRISGFDGGVLEQSGYYAAGSGHSDAAQPDDLRTACLPMQDLDALLLDMFLTKYNGRVSWRHRVTNVGQADAQDQAWVDVEVLTGDLDQATAMVAETTRLTADYVVGCDGANSTVRKSLFGAEYPGMTWDAQIIATNTYYDFTQFGFEDAAFIIHPEHFFVSLFPESPWEATLHLISC